MRDALWGLAIFIALQLTFFGVVFGMAAIEAHDTPAEPVLEPLVAERAAVPVSATSVETPAAA